MLTAEDMAAIDTALRSRAVRLANWHGAVEADDLRQAAAERLLTAARPPGYGYAVQQAQWAMLEEVRAQARQSRPVPMPETVTEVGPENYLRVRQALRSLAAALSPQLLRVLEAIAEHRGPKEACAALGITQGMASIARRQAAAVIDQVL